MACYASGILKISEISKGMPYCFRYRLQDNVLNASAKRHGILVPIIVMGGEKFPVVIAGHRRFYAAQVLRMQKIPALITKKMGPKEAFLLNLVSNWKQGYSDMDRAKALEMTVQKFHFKENEILSIVMPLLGLPSDNIMLKFYRKVSQLQISFKDLIENGQLPFRGISPFLGFSKNDQDYFAKNIGANVKLTSSQLLQAGEWLSDIIRRTGKCFREFCREHKILAKLDKRGMDPRMKADRFFADVKRLRFPGYSLRIEEFEAKRSDILQNSKEFRLEPVPGFEEPGFELHARVRTSRELDQLLLTISQKRSLLNSLFEIVL